jgi:hypothetical protein
MFPDFIGFTKDNINSRKDFADLCDHPTLEARTNQKGNLTRPRALYCLKLDDRKEVLKWLDPIMFLYCYVSNIKWVVNINIESYDYHTRIERMMPVMFYDYLNLDSMMQRLENGIVVLVCKMEIVFLEGWFNLMQHF